MLPYYIAYGMTLLASVLCKKSGGMELRRSNRRYCVMFSIIWILLLGLRHPSMGVDLRYGSAYGYLGQFEYIGTMSWLEVLLGRVQHYERGYIILNKLLSSFGDSYQILLFTCALMSISLISIWICLNSDYPTLSAIIYLGLPCFLINFSGLRQCLAISITTISIEMIKKRKLIWFILLVLLACTFHSSSWIFLVAYPLYHLKMGKSVSILSILLPAIVYVLRYPLFNVLSKLFKKNAVPDGNDAFMLFLVFWAVYAFAVLFGHERDEDELGLRNLFLVTCACQAMGGVYSTVLRAGYYFMVSLVVLLPRIVRNNKSTFHWKWSTSSTLIMYLLIFVCFAVFGLYSISRGSWAMSNPYSFFWE